MAVVKAGAYGHGLEEISKILERNEVAFLGVANIGEARRIREAGVKTPIYLLGATWSGEREEIVARCITPCISTIAEAAAFDEIAKRRGVVQAVHLALDTGMGRGGFLPSEFAEKSRELMAFSSLNIEGIASHFCASDEDEDFTNQQIAVFSDAIKQTSGSCAYRWQHLSNSAGILAFPEIPCNLVRPGLMLYGISPLPQHREKLLNVMSLKSRVTLVRTLPAGHGVSYGRTFLTEKPTRVATIGIGYGDGYPRHVSGKNAEVFIRGQRYPLIGRVTMDQIMVALPDDSAIACGDEVEMFGSNIPVTEVATWADSIAWEVFTGITSRVQRVYLDH